MVPLGDRDAKAKTSEVSKKPTTSMGITEMKKVIDEILTIPVITKKFMSSSCHVSGLPRCISLKKFQDIMRKKTARKERDRRGKRRMEEEIAQK